MEGRKFVCKYCSKRFPCGKSLGGHIRTHMTEERSNADVGDNMFTKLEKKRKALLCEDAAYGLRENPKKTMRFVHSGGGASASIEQQEERVCKECGKGFPSLKALCGHMACHSEKEKRTIKFEESEKKLKLVMDSHSDTETWAPSHPRRSKRMRVKKTVNLSDHPFSSPSSSVVPLANGSSPVEQEQEEVARCLMMLSRDSSFKGRFASVIESSNNNSIILEAKSPSLNTWIGATNGNNNNNFVSNNACDVLEKKLLKVKDVKLKSAAEFGASDNSGSRCLGYGRQTKMLDSDVSNDEFKGPKMEDKSRFFEDNDVESGKIANRGSSKYTATVAKKLVTEDLDYDRTGGTSRKLDSLGHDLVAASSKKIANDFDNELYENGTKGWKYECLNGEMDDGSYDSMDISDENSSESDSFPTPRSHNRKALNGKNLNKAKKKLKSKKIKDHECPICFRIFKSGQALGGHKRSHFIGGSEENTLVIKQAAPVAPCLLDLNLPAPVDE
ncbi:hypothetical protein Fmac_005905 [Flemingia macrophylla]|uniref:C2H2-type domain-containing protein n=1 Tax=Flemingia macrophylla TaxID=520843 RepID=A0ABD1N977_9FABA